VSAAVAVPRTLLGSLQHSHNLLTGFEGAPMRRREREGRKKEKGEKDGRKNTPK